MITIEHDAAFVQARRREVALHGLERIVQVVHAPLQPLQIGDGLVVDYYSVAALDAIKQATREAGAAVDLLVVDGPPETQASASAGSLGRYPALPLMAEILAPNATVLVDDARRHSAMLDLWLAKLCCFDYSTDTFYSEKGAAVLYRHAERETGERVNRRVEEWFAP